MEKIYVNCSTGQTTVVPLTAEEIAALEISTAKAQSDALMAIAEKETARQALLAKLGITEEEARLLLGGN